MIIQQDVTEGGDFDRKDNELGLANLEMNEIALLEMHEGVEEQDYGYMVAIMIKLSTNT